MSRTFVVGLDGASWELLEPWIDEGILPNLDSIRRSGTWAGHESCLPPVTFPNWKCYSAGKNPGKLGVYWFERIDLDKGKIEIMSGADFQTAELWDYLNDAGLTTGVINMPTMYPPRTIDGPIVCGGPDAVDGEYRSIETGFTSPPDLEDRLVDVYNYRVHPDPLLSSNDETGREVDEILNLLEKRFQVAVDLFEEEELDFVHVTLFYLNVLHHFFWNDEPTLRAWRLVDKWVGKIHEFEDVNLIIMSDHGSAATHTEFYVNEWLAQEGYLTKRWTVDETLRTVGLTRERLLSYAKAFGIVQLLADTVPNAIQQRVPKKAGAKRQRKMKRIVLSDTKALASGQGPIYLNRSFDTSTVRSELVNDLTKLTDERGEPLFEAVYRSEEVYSGPFTDIGPDIVIEQRPGVHINDGLGGHRVLTAPDRWAAENTPHGIFIANGPDYESLGEIDEISILDIAPTILATYGSAIPTDCDGKVLPIITKESTWETRQPIPPSETKPNGADDAVTDRLTQLGYME